MGQPKLTPFPPLFIGPIIQIPDQLHSVLNRYKAIL